MHLIPVNQAVIGVNYCTRFLGLNSFGGTRPRFHTQRSCRTSQTPLLQHHTDRSLRELLRSSSSSLVGADVCTFVRVCVCGVCVCVCVYACTCVHVCVPVCKKRELEEDTFLCCGAGGFGLNKHPFLLFHSLTSSSDQLCRQAIKKKRSKQSELTGVQKLLKCGVCVCACGER